MAHPLKPTKSLKVMLGKRESPASDDKRSVQAKRPRKDDELDVKVTVRHIDVNGRWLADIINENQTLKQTLAEKQTALDNSGDVQSLKKQLEEKDAYLEGVYLRNDRLNKAKDDLTHKVSELEKLKSGVFAENRKLEAKIAKLEKEKAVNDDKGVFFGNTSTWQASYDMEKKRVGELSGQVARLEQELDDERKRNAAIRAMLA